MPYRGWFDRGGAATSQGPRATLVASCIGAAALVVACLPESDLSSYSAGLPLSPVASSARGVTDAGVVDTRTSPLIDDAGSAGGELTLDAARAAPLSRLACRPECDCELRAGRDFMFCQTRVAHAQGAARCEAAGGALVSIDDAAENTWLSQRMAALADDGYWISGTDAEDEGVWRWADGRVFFDVTADAAAQRFALWDEGQPNDLDGEDCLRVIDGLWRDLDCDELIAYACER